MIHIFIPKLVSILSFIAAVMLIGVELFFIYILAEWTGKLGLILLILVGGFLLSGTFIWFGIKTLKTNGKKMTSSLKIVGAFSILTISAIPFGGYGILNSSLFTSIDERYFWNDGPWVIFGRDPTTEITISWLTAQPLVTQIEFGSTPDSFETLKSNNRRSYLHHVQLTNLSPNTRYYYRINVNFEAEHVDDVFSFKTAPQSTDAFSCIIVGDMQPSPGNILKTGNLVAQRIAAENPDFVLQLGDLTYSGDLSTAWHYSMQNFPLYAANAPFQVAVGNHDYGVDGELNFRKIFHYPYASTTGLYHSFDYGNAHFIMIDNFDAGDYVMTEIQKFWVEQDILDSKMRGLDWNFIAFHHTIFTTGTSGQNYELQQWMVPLADKYDIDGIFFGHDHHYEHWNYTYGNQGILFNENDSPSGNETHYWMTGNGGADLEIDYGLLTHEIMVNERELYNVTKGEYQTVLISRTVWNKSLYFENPNPLFAEYYPSNHILYHDPDIQSYSSDNILFGYEYGEETWNYIKVEMNANGTSCVISVHYPNGELIKGPNGMKPQIWSFSK